MVSPMNRCRVREKVGAMRFRNSEITITPSDWIDRMDCCCRSSGGVEVHSEGDGSVASDRHARLIRHHHLRHHWP